MADPVEDPLDDAQWRRLDNSFMQSPLANILQGKGLEIKERRVHNLPQRTWRIQKHLAYGITTPVLTIMGKERGKSTQGKRGWREGRALVDKMLDMTKGLPAMNAVMTKSAKSLDDHRGILDVEALGAKIPEYTHVNPIDTDPDAMRRFEEYLVDVWDELATQMSGSPSVGLDETASWFPQFPSNKNSGHPYNMPISKERFENVDWPNWRGTIKEILNVDEMDIETVFKAPQVASNANYPIYMAGARSPDRLIFMTRLFAKIIGAFMNHNVVNGLKGKSDIAWSPITEIHEKTQLALSRAHSVMFDDLQHFDTRVSLEMLKAMLSSLRRSNFAKSNHELRMSIEFGIVELMHTSTLQLGPTRYIDLRPTLWSGVSGTQLFGSVIHKGFYKMAKEELSLGIINEDILSDDGKAETDHSQPELDRIVFGEYAEMLKSLGFLLHPEKTFTSDPETVVDVGYKDGERIEYHDTGPFLQWFMGRDYIFGNFPRRMWSLYEKERDSSQEAMYDVVKKYAGSLRSVRSGHQIPETYFDLFRCASVISTMGPDTPVIDEVDSWFVNTWPSFEKRFTRMFQTVDDGLWVADIPSAGGTLESGLTVSDTIGKWQSILTDQYEPVWDANL